MEFAILEVSGLYRFFEKQLDDIHNNSQKQNKSSIIQVYNKSIYCYSGKHFFFNSIEELSFRAM